MTRARAMGEGPLKMFNFISIRKRQEPALSAEQLRAAICHVSGVGVSGVAACCVSAAKINHPSWT